MPRILLIGTAWVVLACSAPAQSNAIFTGGAGDGYARNGVAQAISTGGIFSGGSADGYARGAVVQPVSTAGIFSGGIADGYARGAFVQPISTAGIFSGGTADGYARAAFAQPVSTSGIFTGGASDGYARSGIAQPLSTAGIFTGGAGDGYARDAGTNVRVSIEGLALLEGPWNTGTQLMNDNLRAAGLIPLTEPYTALGYANVAGSGGETTTAGMLAVTGPGAVVDWVRVELRDGTVPSILVAAAHALLTRDGGIIDPISGSDIIELPVTAGNYFVVVRHRNHLGVMTSDPIALSAATTVVDFSSQDTDTFGSEPQKSIGTKNLLWAGDVTGNHQVKYTGVANDRDLILVAVGGTVPTNTLTGQYRAEDVNLDGVVKYTGSGNDRDPILVNIGGTVPTNARQEQVP